MSKYIFTSAPESKGTRVLIYDKSQDVFYTAPRSVATPPLNMQPNRLDRIYDCLIVMVWLLFFLSAWLLDVYIWKYISNKYIYCLLSCAILFWGNTIARKSRIVCPLWRCSIDDKQMFFSVAENLQTAEQRQKYFSSFNPIRTLFIQLSSMLAFVGIYFCMVLISPLYPTMLYMSLFVAFCIPLLAQMSIATYKDKGQEYFWNTFGRKK